MKKQWLANNKSGVVHTILGEIPDDGYDLARTACGSVPKAQLRAPNALDQGCQNCDRSWYPSWEGACD